MIKSASGLFLQSKDQDFGISLSGKVSNQLLSQCERAGVLETGGILLGRYSDDHALAVVTRVTGPPPDSVHGRVNFHRGLEGLQRLLDRLWRRKEYYLGEWHFHPHSSPEASKTDTEQMLAFAKDEGLRCPETILLIIGGNPTGHWDFSGTVVTRSGKRVPLCKIEASLHGGRI